MRNATRSDSTPRYVDTPRAAEVLDVSRRTLEAWRVRGGGPPYVVLSATGRRGAVRYRLDELLAWADGQARRSTSDLGAEARAAP
ncbi:MAG TPA: helix-turn-helix domain-containing protein [Thermoanaerobaculia bacterium]|nr:helix-turn-helix domain-containing protein [Thermoanaerobaculia bacterium]